MIWTILFIAMPIAAVLLAVVIYVLDQLPKD